MQGNAIECFPIVAKRFKEICFRSLAGVRLPQQLRIEGARIDPEGDKRLFRVQSPQRPGHRRQLLVGRRPLLVQVDCPPKQIFACGEAKDRPADEVKVALLALGSLVVFPAVVRALGHVFQIARLLLHFVQAVH